MPDEKLKATESIQAMIEGERKRGQPHLTAEQAHVALMLRRWGASRPDVARIFSVRPDTIRRLENGTTYNLRLCQGCDAPVAYTAQVPYCRRCKSQLCASCDGYKSSWRRSQRCADCDRKKSERVHLNHGDHCAHCGVEKPTTRKDRLCAECRDESDIYYKRKRATYEIPCARCGRELPRVKHWTRNLCRDCARRHDQLRNSLKRRLCAVEGCGKAVEHLKNDLKCKKCLSLYQKEAKIFKKEGVERLTPEKYLETEQKRKIRLQNGRKVEIPLESLRK